MDILLKNSNLILIITRKKNNYHFQVLINSFLNRLFLLSFFNFPRFNDWPIIFGRMSRYFEFVNLQTIT